MHDLMFKIQKCSELIRKIEEIEFELIELLPSAIREKTRLIKRELIMVQTGAWNHLDTELLSKKSEEVTKEWQITAEYVDKKKSRPKRRGKKK